MKQIITCAIVVAAAFSANADFSALTFKTTGGTDHSIEITGLEVTFAEETLTATNSKTTISLPLAQVESMEFTDASSVDTICCDRLTEETTVYDLDGSIAGTFASFSEAMTMLPAGVYIFRYADGTTLKIAKK